MRQILQIGILLLFSLGRATESGGEGWEATSLYSSMTGLAAWSAAVSGCSSCSCTAGIAARSTAAAAVAVAGAAGAVLITL